MSQLRSNLSRLRFFEEALDKTGWGLYYKFLVGFSSLCLFTNGFVLVCIHFALPLSACDTLLDQNHFINIFICFCIGKLIGGFVLCAISDNTGKKCMISKTLILTFGSCFMCAFSHNVYTLYMAIIFLGSGLEANQISIKIHLSEILVKNRRGLYNIVCDICWTCGYFTSAVFLYYFGNQNSPNNRGMDMRLTSWRIIFAIAGGLCIIMACISALLETSPRFLLYKRRIITASLILKQFYAINKSKYSETFDIQSQQLVDLVRDYEIHLEPEAIGIFRQCLQMLRILTRMLRLLFKRRFLKVFVLISLIRLPNFFGVIGWNLYFSHLLTPGNLTGIVSGWNFLHLNLQTNEITGCSIFIEKLDYETFLLISLNIFFAQFLLLLVLERFGRKLSIFSGLALCSLTSLLLAFSKNHSILAITSSIFVFAFTITECCVSIVIIENLPTAIRGTATALTQLYPLLASCFLYKFLEILRRDFLVFMSTLFFGSSIMACFLPELKNQPMIE